MSANANLRTGTFAPLNGEATKTLKTEPSFPVIETKIEEPV